MWQTPPLWKFTARLSQRGTSEQDKHLQEEGHVEAHLGCTVSKTHWLFGPIRPYLTNGPWWPASLPWVNDSSGPWLSSHSPLNITVLIKEACVPLGTSVRNADRKSFHACPVVFTSTLYLMVECYPLVQHTGTKLFPLELGFALEGLRLDNSNHNSPLRLPKISSQNYVPQSWGKVCTWASATSLE